MNATTELDQTDVMHEAVCDECGVVAQNSDRVLVEAEADDHEEDYSEAKGYYGHDVTVETDPEGYAS